MYITTPLSPRYPQIPMDALFDFDNEFDPNRYKPMCDPSATTTSIRDRVPDTVFARWRPERMLNSLLNFIDTYSDMINLQSYSHLYRHYEIPKKKSYKTRPIDDPCAELRQAHSELVRIIKENMPATHHSAAYAYIEKRETRHAVEKHQKNDSHWIAKFDFSNFFGSSTPEFFFRMISQIYPFAWIYENGYGKVVEDAFSLCFLNGGLPQGSQTSPLLTNIMMIPIDYHLNTTLRDYKKHNFVYTRYADDMHISCKYTFNVKDVEGLIIETLEKFKAPFGLNAKKTHYGSRAGRNHMLGFTLNKDNQITVGHDEKRFFKAALNNYILDRKSKKPGWDLTDVQQLAGKLNYFRYHEKEYFNALIERMNNKYKVDVDAMLKHDIANL